MLKPLPLLLLTMTVAAWNTVGAQQAASSPTLHFEVVSVRESKPNLDGSYSMRYDSDD